MSGLGTRGVRVNIAVCGAVSLVNFVGFCSHLGEIATGSIMALVMATANWACMVMALWTFDICRSSLWRRQAWAAGPPSVYTWPSGVHEGTPTQLPVWQVPMGVDPRGAPAWLVPDPLDEDAAVMVQGLTRHAALYVFIDGGTRRGVVRLTSDRR